MRAFLIDPVRREISVRIYSGTVEDLKAILSAKKIDVVEGEEFCFVAGDDDDVFEDEEDPKFFFDDWEHPHYQQAAIVGPKIDGDKFGELVLTRNQVLKLIKFEGE